MFVKNSKKNQSTTIKQNKKKVENRLKKFFFRLAKVLTAVMRDQDCKVIIFAQTKKRVDDFFHTIRRLGYPVFPIHGDKRQQERDRVLQGLKNRVESPNEIFFVLRISKSISCYSHCN